ncbi:DUF4389 domain-containing protein [Actinokineospora enzanensis]|uniref:DUF4389 domain-containing protein n=1 Tax=Actinokineospora enzanensis TaxID=155975 RepID=UPI000375BAA1|nr:DUF4389 domain-containing protein [Actinokineospora enzanensis]
MDGGPGQVRVTGVLDAPSRWLWLVKWVLLIPHFLALATLWVCFVVATVVAFFAILVTGRYPRPLFDFTVGVLRWSWRVHYYGYAALGTDRYPPFTLAEVPDYPARLEIDYPERLSRGLVLVKWWLLVLPHYVIVALLAGGGLWWGGDSSGFHWGAGGLVGVLALVAGVVLLFGGRYPVPLHALLVGLDRWVLRVAAYAALLTDEYPPFRLDLGPAEQHAAVPDPPAVAESTSDSPDARRPGWTPGRVWAALGGALLALVAAGLLTGGLGVVVADRTQRDRDGYLCVPSRVFTGAGYAVAAEHIDLPGEGAWTWVRHGVGPMSIRVDADRPVFVGVAPAADVDRYLAGVAHTDIGTGMPMATARVTRTEPGGEPATPPGSQRFWTASSSGSGSVRLVWSPAPGDWTVVVMNADAAPGIDVRATVGVTAPALPWVAAALFTAGALVVAGGAALIIGAVHRAGPRTGPGDTG